VIRKQIYLEEDMVEQVKEIAKINNMSQAEVIRSALNRYLKEKGSGLDRKEPLLELIGIATTDITNGSEKLDEQIYGGEIK
jgi:hypothetical protein